MRIDAHVELRQIREVPHDLRLGQLRQGRGRRRPAHSAAAIRSTGRSGTSHAGSRCARRPDFGKFEQQFCVAGVTHR